ncbi:MAG: hypothetical protein RMI63_08415 [Caldimicrobium sp.]|nr:hypothetical protein [Caldimicrobium sp.]
MSNVNYKELLIKLFSKSLSKEEYQSLERLLHGIIRKSLRYFKSSDLEPKLKKLYTSDYLKELTKDLLIRLFEKKDVLLKCREIKESYLLSMAKNLLLFKLTAEETIIKSIRLEEMKPLWDKEGREDPLEKALNLSYQVDFLEEILIENCFQNLKKQLTTKELETLCWYLKKVFKSREEVNFKKKMVHYKRWERLKPKLKKIFLRDLEDFSEKYPLIFDRILSEICSKFNF